MFDSQTLDSDAKDGNSIESERIKDASLVNRRLVSNIDKSLEIPKKQGVSNQPSTKDRGLEVVLEYKAEDSLRNIVNNVSN